MVTTANSPQQARSRRISRPGLALSAGLSFVLGIGAGRVDGEEAVRDPVRAVRPKAPEKERLPLSPEQREKLDTTVDKGIEYLVAHQNADGSFQAPPMARPAVTALCVMALLSRGYKPMEGEYHAVIERAIDFVLDCQDSDTGVIQPLPSDERRGLAMRAVNYTHGICATMLADVFPLTGRLQYRLGNSGREEPKSTADRRARGKKTVTRRERLANETATVDMRRHERIEKAVRKALSYTRAQQTRPKRVFGEFGGWRYSEPSFDNDSDLSATAWQVMFLHSARQSGFKVPEMWMKAAMKFVHRTFSKKLHGYVYVLSERGRHCTRATVSGGILCLLLGGEPVTAQVKEAAAWILDNPLEPYNVGWEPHDRYHYSAFYCSQAMGVLGGDYFYAFYPRLLRVLTDNQHKDGSWSPESLRSDADIGEVYTTALAVLALSPPYQKLRTYLR